MVRNATDTNPSSPLTNEHVRQALDNLLEGCQVIDSSYRYRYLNPAAARHGRRALDELLGRSMEEAYPGISQTAMFAELRRCMTHRQFVSMDNEFDYGDGTSGWFELRMEPVPDGVFILSIDITERRRAAHEVEVLAARYRNMLDASFDAISITQDGVILEANPGFARLFGFDSVDDVIGKGATEFVAPESLDAASQRLRDNEYGSYELVGQRRDGRKIQLEATSRADAVDGKPARFAVLRDITEQRALEKHVRQSQKMEAVGRLAGGVAHDFNNMLTVIIGHVEMLLQEQHSASDTESLAEVRAAARSASELTKQLLSFSRQQVVEAMPVEVDDVVRSSLKLLRRLLGADVELTTNLRTAGTIIDVDPHQLEQVLLNLAVNARDAMPGGGRLAIETAVVDLDGETSWDITAGQYALITVSDTGTGMDAGTQERIFEPFFTTKEAGRGTGLGLSIAYGVVKQTGGTINVYSEPGMGTVFRIYLPVTADAQTGSSATPAASAVSGGSETILLVEDSKQVREVAHRVLTRQGYRVMSAESPEEALQLMSTGGSRIDLLLTDLVMPQMNGRQLAARFAAANPQARVMFMSGYTDDTALRHGVAEANIPYLQKPFTPDGLSKKVRQVLDAPR